MKAAVVYFSLEGNTKYVAEKIAKELEADLIALIPKRKYPTGKLSKYIWGGKSARSKESPALVPYQFDSKDYDLIVLGTPMWAGTFAPPLRTFLRKNKMIDKKVALYASCSGSSTKKCFKELEKEIPDSIVLSRLGLINPLKKSKPQNDQKILEFCSKLKAK